MAEASGGELHDRRIDCDVSAVQVTSCGGSVGVPSPVCCVTSSDSGPVPTRLNACTTTAYAVYILCGRC